MQWIWTVRSVRQSGSGQPRLARTANLDDKLCDLDGKLCDLDGKLCDLDGKLCDLELVWTAKVGQDSEVGQLHRSGRAGLAFWASRCSMASVLRGPVLSGTHRNTDPVKVQSYVYTDPRI